jgi:hypothetical protein
MQQAKQIISKQTIEVRNNRTKRHLKLLLDQAERIKNDTNKKNRLNDCLCKSCFYISHMRVGGAAITNRPCGICESDMRFSSTATDVVCKPCASENNLCKQCGSHIELKNITSDYPFESNI